MTDTNSQLPATVATNPPAPRPRLWPLWLVAGLALLLTVALVLWGWQQWQYQQRLEQALTHLKESNQQLQQSFGQGANQHADRLQALEQSLSSQQNRLATLQRQIDHNARELLAAGNRTRTDWLLAEAEYLMRVGNQRLLIEKDIHGALTALEEADQVLRESDDVGVYPVRQQLAKEVLALKTIAEVDRTGLYLALDAVIASLQELTFGDMLSNKAPELVVSGATEEPAETDMLGNAWRQVKATLTSAVNYRRLDEVAKPLMSPDQAAYARLNIQLMLEEAELAVLRGNQPLYDRALSKAHAALAVWHDGSDQRIGALLARLDELQGKQVDPELPDISQSLQLLKARLSGRLNAGDADTPDAPGQPATGGSES